MPPPPPPPSEAMPSASSTIMVARQQYAPPHEALSTGAACVEEHEAQLAALLTSPETPLHADFAVGGAAALRDLIRRLPKAELHVHIEGTLQPDLMFRIARANGVALPYADVASAAARRESFTCLRDFLEEYVACTEVLRTEEDYYQLARDYLKRAAEENVVRSEIFVDAQGHVARGIPLGDVVRGIERAAREAPSVDVSLILCLQRERGAAAAAEALEAAKPLIGSFCALGLAGNEVGYPPEAFADVFDAAAALGLRRVAHAGEEGGPDTVAAALDALRVDRVDHGIRSLEDPALVARMAAARVPITLCPISNLRLQVYAGCLEERVREVLGSGIVVTLNSDDPAFFGSYVDGNFEYVARVAGLGADAVAALARNSFEASFLSEDRKRAHVKAVGEALAEWRREQQQQQQQQLN